MTPASVFRREISVSISSTQQIYVVEELLASGTEAANEKTDAIATVAGRLP
jgi:hypothetical protein